MEEKMLRDLSQVNVDPEIVSRGTGQPIERKDALVYDFMPRILGDRFRAVGRLRDSVHFYGERSIPFLVSEEAYRTLAEQELKDGNIYESLEAYKRGLHNRTGFTNAIAAIQGNALLSPAEIQRLNLEGEFGDLEDRLIRAVVSQDVAFNLRDYVAFLGEIRQEDKELHQLMEEYCHYYFRKDMEGQLRLKEPTINACVRALRYYDAYVISRETGDEEGAQKYKEMAEQLEQSKENPKLEPILRPMLDRIW